MSAAVLEPVTEAAPARVELRRGDRCDRCGAEAFVATEHTLPENGRTVVLLFCAHHFRRHEELLAPHVVQDNRSLINVKPSPSD